VRAHLQPGESPRYALYAAYGPLTTWTRRFQPHYGIVVTDRAVLVFRPSRGLKVKMADEVRRLPRATRFDPVGQWWRAHRRADLASEPIWVHWQFLKDAREADAELSSSTS
jgi:hypothetical protein